MKKKILSLLLAAIMVFSLLPVTAFAESAHTHDAETATKKTFATEITTLDGLKELFTTGESGYLAADITATESLTVAVDVDLCLNGYVISANGGNFSVITVDTGATLNLYDCDNDTEHNGHLDSNGLWHLDTETYELQNGEKDYPVTGGVITGASQSAGMDNIFGGGVYVEGTLNMYGGTICGNYVAYGGGVHASASGSFNMYGGTICGNVAAGLGGGINNASTIPMTIESGKIIGNKAKSGGGIQTNLTGSLKLTAASGKAVTITGNTATGEDGGVVNCGTMELSGKVIIKDNICSTNNKPVNLATCNAITITGALTGSDIYITHMDYSDNHDAGVLTTGYTEKNTGAGLNDFFHYDGSSAYTMVLNDSNELEVIKKLVRDLTVKNGGEAAAEGEDYEWKDNVLHIKKDGMTVGMTVSGSSTALNSIVVDSGVGTLTLNGVKIIPTNAMTSAVMSNSDDLTINIVGNCQLGNKTPPNSEVKSQLYVTDAISAAGNITLVGDGNEGTELVLCGTNGIHVTTGNVAIKDLKVTVNSGRDALDPGTGVGNIGIYVENGNIDISGAADVAVGGHDYGIHSKEGNITVGANYADAIKLYADGYKGGIRAFSGNITISAGTVTVRSHQWGIGIGAIDGEGSPMEVVSGDITISGRNTIVTAQGGIETKADDVSSASGVYVAGTGKLSVSGGAVLVGSGYQYGVYANEVSIGGNTTSLKAIAGKYKTETENVYGYNSTAVGIQANSLSIDGGTVSAFGVSKAMSCMPNVNEYSDGAENVVVISGDEESTAVVGTLSDCNSKKYAEVYSKILRKMLSVDEEGNVKISGKDISVGKLAGYGLSYDKETSTLTLNSIQQDMSMNSTPNFNCGIKVPSNTNLVLTGSSSIKAPKSASEDKPSYGVYSIGNLTVTGTGSLSVQSTAETKKTIEVAAGGTLSVGAAGKTATLTNATADSKSISKSNGAVTGSVLTSTVQDSPVVIAFVPIITVEKSSSANYPVAGKEKSAYQLYDVSADNFAVNPTLTLQWKNTVGDTWDGSAPDGVMLGTDGKITTTTETVAGDYIFRITNGVVETILDEDSGSSTYNQDIPNPAFVSSGEITLTIKEESECIYTEKVNTPVSGESYLLKLGGCDKGEFTFAKLDGGWSIKQTGEGEKYLAMQDGKLVQSAEPFAWTYKSGAFYTTVKTTQKSSGYWFGFIYIPGRGSKTVTTTYYLSTVTEGAKLSTCCVCAELYKEVTDEHVWGCWIDCKDGENHKHICKHCGEEESEAHSYGETTHKCVCGAYDPSCTTVDVTAIYATKTTKQFSGFLFWGTWKNVTTYTATVKVDAEGMKVTKVEVAASENGYWTKGNTFTSNSEIEQFFVRVTTSDGEKHLFRVVGEIGIPAN